MSLFIIMTPSEAGIVRDPLTTITPRYVPIRRGNDPVEVYILPVSILSSVPHQAWWGFLGDLPQLDHTDPNFPEAYEPPEE